MDIHALIFDLDGVLTDTVETHYLSWKRLMDEESIPFTLEDNEELRGLERRESLRRILKGRTIDETLVQEWMRRKNDYFYELLDVFSPANRLPGVPRILDEGRAAGLKIGLASSSRNAKAVLDKLELREHFDAIADGNTVARAKPAPDSFVWTAGALGVTPMQAVVFEDSEAGVKAARHGGFWIVGLGSPANVGRAHILLPDLSQATVKTILESIEQVSSKG